MHTGNISLWECILQCFAFSLCGFVEMAMLSGVLGSLCGCLPSIVLWNHHECQHLYSWNLSHLDQWGPLWSYAYICYFPQPLLWCQHHLPSLLLCPPAPEIHLFWWVCQWAWGYWLPVLGDISLFCPRWILTHTHTYVLRIPSAEGTAMAFSICPPTWLSSYCLSLLVSWSF